MIKSLFTFLVMTVCTSAYANPNVIQVVSETMENACFITTIEATNQAIAKGMEELLSQSMRLQVFM